MRHVLLSVSALALLAGCDWFGSSTPANTVSVRPGAERQVQATSSLPPAGSGRQYDTSLAPVDETRCSQLRAEQSSTEVTSIVARPRATRP